MMPKRRVRPPPLPAAARRSGAPSSSIWNACAGSRVSFRPTGSGSISRPRVSQLYRDNRPVFTSRVVVGEIDKQTPELQTSITSVLFNPSWYVPRSIVTQEILPKLARDPNYLTRHRMVMRSNGGIQQLPGAGTALGRHEIRSDEPFRCLSARYAAKIDCSNATIGSKATAACASRTRANSERCCWESPSRRSTRRSRARRQPGACCRKRSQHFWCTKPRLPIRPAQSLSRQMFTAETMRSGAVCSEPSKCRWRSATRPAERRS